MIKPGSVPQGGDGPGREPVGRSGLEGDTGRRGDGPSPLVLAGAGLELGMVTAVMTLGGQWMDRKLDTAPWLMLGGLAVGLIGGTYNVWRLAKRFF